MVQVNEQERNHTMKQILIEIAAIVGGTVIVTAAIWGFLILVAEALPPV